MKKSSVLENSLPRDYSPISSHRSEDRGESYSLNAQLRNDVKESRPHGPARRKGRTMSVVPTENSVRINPHPCGTLIADLVDALFLSASTSESKDWRCPSRPVVECIQVQGVREFVSRKNPVLISKSLVA
jgi:hypothetical protein